MVAGAAEVSQPTAYKLIDRFMQQGLIVEMTGAKRDSSQAKIFNRRARNISWVTTIYHNFSSFRQYSTDFHELFVIWIPTGIPFLYL
jgi:hypothetical protein